MNEQFIREVDALVHARKIDREAIFTALEEAVAAALRRHLGAKEGVSVHIDRTQGNISATQNGAPVDPALVGRLALQAAKQTFLQKIREAESETAYREFAHKVGDVVSCAFVRWEGRDVICRIGDHGPEGRIPRQEQVPGETFRPNDRFRALVTEVEKKPTKVRILLSRAAPLFVRKLFELEVPEVANGVVQIRSIAREPGYRTKVTVFSTNKRVDCLGACVGVRGSRIRNVVDELNGENIDIIRWSDDPEDLIRNALKPAEIAHVELDPEGKHATVWVTHENLSQAIGRQGRNVRLAVELTGWEIDIYDLSEVAESPSEAGGAGEPQPTTDTDAPAGEEE
jgi:N utilization substance protein A